MIANPTTFMLAVSLASWLVSTAIVGRAVGLDLLLGMLGPLAAAAGSWILVERTHRRSPEAVTPVMIASFGTKMLFFGAYVALMLRVVGVRPIPFVASFTAYFVALYLIEALSLRRLFAGR
jgi:hypothetical protein